MFHHFAERTRGALRPVAYFASCSVTAIVGTRLALHPILAGSVEGQTPLFVLILSAVFVSTLLGCIHIAAYSAVSGGTFWPRVHVVSGAAVGIVVGMAFISSPAAPLISPKVFHTVFWSAFLAAPALAAAIRSDRPRV